MNRKKRISTELLEKYPDKFGPEFDANKKALHEIATVTSKVLRNEVAGYMASHLRKKAAAEKASSAMAEETDETEEESDEE
ncbi:MAG: 30S ribosomal protein S17e [Nitrososphaera sp.]|jgi:small subunit ribosomal protein S17e